MMVSPWANLALMAVFSVHAFFFGRAWRRKRAWFYGAFVAAFLLLTVLNGLKAAGSASASLAPVRWSAIGLAAVATLGWVAARLRR